MSNGRPVKRVLVMIEYADRPEHTGAEVYDLTALLAEGQRKSDILGRELGVNLQNVNDYSGEETRRVPHVRFSGDLGGERVYRADSLAHVILMGLPDDERTQRARELQKRAYERAQKLSRLATEEKLRQVSAIAHQYPVATVDLSPLALDIAKEGA